MFSNTLWILYAREMNLIQIKEANNTLLQVTSFRLRQCIKLTMKNPLAQGFFTRPSLGWQSHLSKTILRFFLNDFQTIYGLKAGTLISILLIVRRNITRKSQTVFSNLSCIWNRSSRRRCSVKRSSTLLKKRPQHKCFLAKFAKFLRTFCFTEYPR